MSFRIMFYADDAIFLGEWSDGNISTLIHVLKCFFHASGLKINLNKSKIMGINVESAQVIQAAAKLGCLVLKCPFYYLGTRVGGSMTRVQAWQEIVEKVKSRLSKWKSKTLSIVPSKVLHILESIRSHFFNGHDPGSKKASWVKWNNVLTDKKRGGLDGKWGVHQFLDVTVVFQDRRHEFGMLPSVEFLEGMDWIGEYGYIFGGLLLLVDVSMRYAFRILEKKLDGGFDILDMSVSHFGRMLLNRGPFDFRCGLVRDIANKVLSWWNMDNANLNSYAEWKSWLVSIRMDSKLKKPGPCLSMPRSSPYPEFIPVGLELGVVGWRVGWLRRAGWGGGYLG
ncbi:RNA-directed DNA polymerase, eukaryota, reverse transcriptase zinc-binding domain protein [Tanacetum coccineum]